MPLLSRFDRSLPLSVHDCQGGNPGDLSSTQHRLQLTGGAATLSLRAQLGTLMETATVVGTGNKTSRGKQLRPAYRSADVRADGGGQPPRKTAMSTRSTGRNGPHHASKATCCCTRRSARKGVWLLEAIAAVSRWEFSPTYLNCEPVAVQMYVTVSFKSER